MEKIKLEDFLKDPLPGRWIKDKDGFLTKVEEAVGHPERSEGSETLRSAQSDNTKRNDNANKKVSADLPGEDSSETGESKADS